MVVLVLRQFTAEYSITVYKLVLVFTFNPLDCSLFKLNPLSRSLISERAVLRSSHESKLLL